MRRVRAALRVGRRVRGGGAAAATAGTVAAGAAGDAAGRRRGIGRDGLRACTFIRRVTIHSERTRMASLKDTLNRLATLPKFRSARPATDAEIDAIQRELNVRLPDQYLQFLRAFGYAHWFGHEIFGIRPLNPATGQPSITPDVVAMTNAEKKLTRLNESDSLPPNVLVISVDGGGGVFLLFPAGSPREGEVHWYNFEDAAEAIEVWSSFQEYLEYEIKNAIGRA